MNLIQPVKPLCGIAAWLLGAWLHAQTPAIEFVKPDDALSRPSKEELLKQYEVKAKGLKTGSAYTVTVNVNSTRTTIAPNGYALEGGSVSFTPVGTEHSFSFLLKIKPDEEADRERALVLELQVQEGGADITDKNTGKNKQLKVSLKSAEPLETYNYLVYVGTNFDLVDGPKAKNLFFATNIHLPNKNAKWFSAGAFISLYGNRPISLIDSSGSSRQLVRVESTSDSTYRSFYERSERTIVFTSDNLGAYFSPLINLGPLSKNDNAISLYLAPSAEFIFRRTSRVTTYANGEPTDTVPGTGARPTMDLPDRYVSESNTYEFRYGGGVMLAHEGSRLSVRLYCSIGSSSLYFPQGPGSFGGADTPFERVNGNLSFSGRVWITERTSGITIQAEVLNSLKRPRPFYGVTLSKAIDFKDLGGVFKPLGRD